VAGCQRDVQYFKQLGINTVRVYTVDNSANHDDCMKALADAGIYLALDVNTPAYSLNRADNASIARSYNDVYLQFIFSTIDAFAQYADLLLALLETKRLADTTTPCCFSPETRSSMTMPRRLLPPTSRPSPAI
jgi:hypothetical protein